MVGQVIIHWYLCACERVYVCAMCVRTFSVHASCEMPLCTFRFALDFNPIKIVCAPFYCCCCCCFYCRWWCSDCHRRHRHRHRCSGWFISIVVCIVETHFILSATAHYTFSQYFVLVFHKLVTLALCHTLLSSSVIAIMFTMVCIIIHQAHRGKQISDPNRKLFE